MPLWVLSLLFCGLLYLCQLILLKGKRCDSLFLKIDSEILSVCLPFILLKFVFFWLFFPTQAQNWSVIIENLWIYYKVSDPWLWSVQIITNGRKWFINESHILALKVLADFEWTWCRKTYHGVCMFYGINTISYS